MTRTTRQCVFVLVEVGRGPLYVLTKSVLVSAMCLLGPSWRPAVTSVMDVTKSAPTAAAAPLTATNVGGTCSQVPVTPVFSPCSSRRQSRLSSVLSCHIWHDSFQLVTGYLGGACTVLLLRADHTNISFNPYIPRASSRAAGPALAANNTLQKNSTTYES